MVFIFLRSKKNKNSRIYNEFFSVYLTKQGLLTESYRGLGLSEWDDFEFFFSNKKLVSLKSLEGIYFLLPKKSILPDKQDELLTALKNNIRNEKK
ncbi:MAG: hypothetical protein AAF988_01560 [Pseudomonadota bacterium]